MGDPDEVWLPAEELQTMFNELGFYERVQAGELRERVFKHHVTQPDWSPEPLYRQMARYYDGDTLVAVVNQWQRFNGTLAASGRPDPKKIFVDGKVYWTGQRSE